MLTVKLLKDKNKITGVLCLDMSGLESGRAEYAAFNCKNVVLATGGPAGVYRDVVYPKGHHGSNGLAFEVGARGANLTEWQYGLASTTPRWNVSGTYMQAMPRFISTDQDGINDMREFLTDYFSTEADLLTNVFLKGYQWPFDSEKLSVGSSLIDLCVLNESLKGRRVWLDYRSNPFGKDIDFNMFDADQICDNGRSSGVEVHEYLKKAGACYGTPYDRLLHMNKPAVEFFLEHGVDLKTTPLEIALCAQHNNGGIEVDRWWRTGVDGLFAVGEAAGTHGVRRPGGAALNSGQTGSLRAAQYIAARRTGDAASTADFIASAGSEIDDAVTYAMQCAAYYESKDQLNILIADLRKKMNDAAGAVRNHTQMLKNLDNAKRTSVYHKNLKITNDIEANFTDVYILPLAYTLRELLISQITYLSAFIDYAQNSGKSRGGAIYSDSNGVLPHVGLPESFRFISGGNELSDYIQEIEYSQAGCSVIWRKTRPLPNEDVFFENVWRDFREVRRFDE